MDHKINEVSSANNLALDDNSSAKLFMYTKNSNNHSIKSCTLKLFHVKTSRVSTTPCVQFLKKPHNKLERLLIKENGI